MKIAISVLISTPLLMFSMEGLAVAQTVNVLPTANDVVTKMVQQDALRKAQLYSYTATRRYVAINDARRAEMRVELSCAIDGEKRFRILSEEGSSAIRKHVFYKMLREETDASRRDTSASTHITPANYDFQLIRKDFINERPAYLLLVKPKNESKYLIDGRIWVDAADYSIVRIEGSPAKSPSFWIRSIHFEHTYQKVGPFWFAAATHSVNEIRVFGEAELTIETSDYKLNPAGNDTAKTEYPAGIPR